MFVDIVLPDGELQLQFTQWYIVKHHTLYKQMCYDYKCACTCGSEIRDIRKYAKRKGGVVGSAEDYESPWEAAFDPATKKV